MLPALFGYLSGEAAGSAANGKTISKRFWKNAIFFILGFTIMMMILGAIASLIGQAVKPIVHWVQFVAGVILLFLGLRQMNILSLNLFPSWAKLEVAASSSVGTFKPGYVRSFIAGMVIAPGWGAIFIGSILLVISVNGNFMLNMAQVFAYSVGYSLMLALTFLFFEPMRLLVKRMGDKARRVQQAGGALIMAIGILMVTGKLNWLSGLATWKGGALIKGFLGIN